jgi:uncharacterized protein YdeI (YjbR/CyaY-like superfamily)
MTYADALDEALCFGWIDGIIKKLDRERYARKFTPRQPAGKWSPANKRRVSRLIAGKRMAPAGLRAVETAKANGSWDKPDRPVIDGAAIEKLRRTLRGRKNALAYFDGLAPSHRKRYALWINSAKRPETRRRRIEEAAAMLERKEKLGLR